MKKHLILALSLLFTLILIGQNNPYYSITSMQEYVELENPISINNGEVWDEGASFPVYFDFDFQIFDQTYSSINVMAGGVVFPGLGYHGIRAFFTPFGGYLLKDKGISNSVSNIDYEVVGEEGQYIIKIQWENAGFVQWYTTSDTSDFVNFQIWIFQENGRIELHFGSSQTDPGTYGYPEATSDPNPGPSINFVYTGCESVLCYFSDANNPSYDYLDWCTPNQSFVDGTPSEGITYSIIPNGNTTSFNDLRLDNLIVYPNPVDRYIRINGITIDDRIESVTVSDVQGKMMIYISHIENIRSEIDLSFLSEGVYILSIKTVSSCFQKKLIKLNQ